MGKKKIGLPGGPNEMITDPKGQWDHPGKNTRIEGNQITMQGVEYPVWAQPNVGPGMMMMPGEEHYFQNAEYVDEYPMMQAGGAVTLLKALLKGAGKNTKKIKNIANYYLDDFASEIDWSTVNKDILNNKSLLGEYNAIEKASKADGSWMKYSDGSTFDGSPAQFVQMRSDNFIDYAGGTTDQAEQVFKNKVYRGTGQDNADYTSPTGLYGNSSRETKAVFTTDNPEVALSYKNYNIGSRPKGSGVVQELGYPQTNIPTKLADAQGNNWRMINYDPNLGDDGFQRAVDNNNLLDKFLRDDALTGDIPDLSRLYLNADDYANYLMNNPNAESMAKIFNVKDGLKTANDVIGTNVLFNPHKVPLKSLKRNDGMFNINNPNIFKAAIPGAVAAFTKEQLEADGYLPTEQDGGQNLTTQLRNFQYDKKRNKPFAQYGLENKYPLPQRDGVRLNYDAEGNVIGESTHIMKAEIVDGKWYGFPTLFQNDNNTWDNTFELLINENEKNWMPAFKEAKRRGELIEFGDDMESAIKFGEGSWKKKQEGGGVNEEGVEQYKWFKNYLQSPKYVERLKKEFPDYTDKQIGQEVKSRLENVMQTRVGFLPRSSDISPRVGATQGVYNADEYPGAIMLRPEYSASTSDWIFEPGNYLSGYGTTPLHEWSHAADDGGNRIPQSTNDFMLSRMKENTLGIPKDKYYYTLPTEYLGRMQPLRYLMEQEGLYDAGMEDFTIEDLKKARENKRIKNNVHFENLMDNVKSDEEFIELMNNVAAIDFEKQDDTMMAKKGGSVSWNWKGKSYSGTLIPSMETSKARYARTKNGKIKTLSKRQDGGDMIGQDQKEFLKNWLTSPMGQNLLSNSLNQNEKLINDRTFKRNRELDEVEIESTDSEGKFRGTYTPGRHRILIDNDFANAEDLSFGMGLEDVLLHELSHSQDFGGKHSEFKKSTIPLADEKFIKKLTKNNKERVMDDPELSMSSKKFNYLSKPTEVRARLNAIRYGYENDNLRKGLPSIFESEVTPEMQELMQSNSQYKQLQEIYTQDEINQLLNTISFQDNDSSMDKFINAKYGTELPKAQSGIIKNLIKKGGPRIMKYIDNLLGKTDDVVKAAPAVAKQKGLYEMLPIKKLEYPTHYGTTDTPDTDVIVNALDMLKAQGKYADDVGFQIKDLVGENIQYLGNQGGRTIVNVPLPNGKNQMFYKSSGLAGKKGSGVGGTSEGLWQPYAGHANILDFPDYGKVENWFIKDSGYKNWYDSQSFRDIAGNLDRIAAEQGWDMSQQILKSKLEYGGDIPKAQRGLIKGLLKSAAEYADEVIPSVKNYFKKADDFEFKTLPGIESKQFMRVVDGQFDQIEYQHLIPTQQEISDIAKSTRKRLFSDKFIKNNMEATGRSKDEITSYIDDYIKEFENSVIDFNKIDKSLNAQGLYNKGKITIDPRNPHLTKDNVLGTLEHEIEHMFSSVARNGSDLYRHPVLKVAGTDGTSAHNKLMKNISQPFEQQVRLRKALGWLEKNADLKPGGNVTDEQVKKLTDAMANWSKESGKDFRGTGAYADVQHLFGNLDIRQFLDDGQYLLPGAKQTADITKPNVRKAIKDILNKTYIAIPAIGAAFTTQELQEDGYLPTQQEGGEEREEFIAPFSKEDWEYYRSKFKPTPYPPPGITPTPEPKSELESKPAVSSYTILSPESLLRQAFAESTFRPDAVSDMDARGIAQFRPITIKEMQRLGIVDDTFDPFDINQAIPAQRAYMTYLSERPQLTQGSEESINSKILFAYNRGLTGAVEELTNLKNKGVEIYKNTDWVDQINNESSNYVKKIYLKSNDKFNKEYEDSLTNDKYKSIRDLYFKRSGGEAEEGSETVLGGLAKLFGDITERVNNPVVKEVKEDVNLGYDITQLLGGFDNYKDSTYFSNFNNLDQSQIDKINEYYNKGAKPSKKEVKELLENLDMTGKQMKKLIKGSSMYKDANWFEQQAANVGLNAYLKKGGESKIYKVYKDYINGNATDKNSEMVYDKLNRIHYKDAKQAGMGVPNYIMSYLVGNS